MRRANQSLALAIGLTNACQSGGEYGIGTYCDDSSPCRNPLVCKSNRCELRDHVGGSAGASGATIDATGGATPISRVGGGTSGGGSANATAGATDVTSGGRDSMNGGAASGAGQTSGSSGAADTASPGGSNAGGTNAGGTNAGGTNAGGTNVGGTNFAGAGPGGIGQAGSDWSAAGQAGVVATAGSSQAQLGLGARCTTGRECESAECVDGVCCDSPCDAQCKACDLENHVGQCSALTSGQPKGSRPPCGASGETCGGSCKGADVCTYPGLETACIGMSACLSDTSSLTATHCDGQGSCGVKEQLTCGSGESCSINDDGRCAKPYFTQVDIGFRNGCAVRSDGVLYCWGANEMGQLGVADPTPQLRPSKFPSMGKVRSVAVGYWHVCYVQWDGQVDCWGYNPFNVLGCNTSVLESQHCTPLPAGSGAIEVASTNTHACARFSQGKLQCWGNNHYGQVGSNRIQELEAVPIDVVGLKTVKSLSLGLWHSAIVTDAGILKTWGSNEEGQLGIGRSGSVGAPTEVYGLTRPMAQLSANGVNHTCVLLQDESVYCWGDNTRGQIGLGLGTSIFAPQLVRIPSSGVRAVAAGDQFTCLLEGDGSVSCWGTNDRGNFGDGTFDSSVFPHRATLTMDAMMSIRTIVAKYATVCALGRDGRIWCWGDNGCGQLGNGTTSTTGLPTEVIIP